jgi:adenosine deaminase
MFCDLHNHLYGCLSAEKLFEIGIKNPNPRWHLFLDSYQQAYSKKIDYKNFFENYNTIKKFSELYYFNHKGTFLEFQAKFNLIIALVQYTPEEMNQVAQSVVVDHANQGVSHVEYRIMFSADESKSVFEDRILNVCEGLKQGEKESKRKGHFIRAEAVLSLHRDKNTLENYIWLKELISKYEIVNSRITGIDFCHIEEGNPPKKKKDFFDRVLKDNHAEPNSSLAILYHVGESFQDKTPFSAVRWVYESAFMGAHRLGHCIALGLSPYLFSGSKRTESIEERIDQLRWELDHFESISNFGDYYSKEELERSLKNHLIQSNKSNKIEFLMKEKEIIFLSTLQSYVINRIKIKNTIIESCPSSNTYIGMIDRLEDHPISAFLKNKMKVTIATDDPGIFNTNIQKEYKKVREMGISDETLDSIQKNSFQYKSSILSGRLNTT